MNAFWIALQFLTRIPCPDTSTSEQQLGRSALFYPHVGALIGLLLVSIAWLFGLSTALAEHSGIYSALILSLWVTITGALHLDGLGDSADAWLGGGNDRQRCLEIMQDPRTGSAAVTSIALIIIIKFAALEILLAQQVLWPLLFAPIIGRGTGLALLLSTPNAHPQGLSAKISKNLPRNTALALLVGTSLLIITAAPVIAASTLFCVAVITYLLRRLMLQRLGGATGDTCGAAIEITEASVLLCWCLTV